MKTSLFLFLLMPLLAQSQKIELPIKDGKIFYEAIDSVENTSKDVLYGRAKKWFTKYFNSAKDVIQSDDKENGILIGKGIFLIPNQGFTSPVMGTYEVSVKDNKFRIRAYNFFQLFEKYDDQPLEFNYERYLKGELKKSLPKFFERTNSKILLLISSLKEDMKTNDDF